MINRIIEFFSTNTTNTSTVTVTPTVSPQVTHTPTVSPTVTTTTNLFDQIPQLPTPVLIGAGAVAVVAFGYLLYRLLRPTPPSNGGGSAPSNDGGSPPSNDGGSPPSNEGGSPPSNEGFVQEPGPSEVLPPATPGPSEVLPGPSEVLPPATPGPSEILPGPSEVLPPATPGPSGDLNVFIIDKYLNIRNQTETARYETELNHFIERDDIHSPFHTTIISMIGEKLQEVINMLPHSEGRIGFDEFFAMVTSMISTENVYPFTTALPLQLVLSMLQHVPVNAYNTLASDLLNLLNTSGVTTTPAQPITTDTKVLCCFKLIELISKVLTAHDLTTEKMLQVHYLLLGDVIEAIATFGASSPEAAKAIADFYEFYDATSGELRVLVAQHRSLLKDVHVLCVLLKGTSTSELVNCLLASLRDFPQ